MAILNEDALKKDITSKTLAKTYLLFGEDSFLKKTYCDKLIDLAYDGDPFFNLQKFESDCDLQDVYNAVEQLPMMADSKCVCITDYDFEHAKSSDFERLCEIIESSHDECVLILRFDFIEVDAKHSAKAKKLIASVEKSGGKPVRLDHKKSQELTKVVCDAATKRGAKLDAATARYLIEVCGNDLSILKNEIEKLAFFVKGGEITKSDIDNVSVKTIDESIFDLAKNIFSANTSSAFDMLDSLFFMRVEPVVILYALSSAFLDLYRVFAAKKSGKSIQYVADTFGYGNRSFTLEKYPPLLSRVDADKFYFCFEALRNADKALKSTGAEPRAVLEQLIIKLIYIIVKGESIDKTSMSDYR